MSVGETTVDLCLRSASLAVADAGQRSVLHRFEALAADGLVDGLEVCWWTADAGSPAGPRGSAELPRPVTELLVIADAMAFDLGPPESTPSVPADAGVPMPPVATQVREGGTTVGVYPLHLNGTAHSVEDCLTALGAGERAANLMPFLTD